MTAILLVGGQGTRLRPLTLGRPKGLLPVLNRPFLAYQLDLLREGGIKDVLFAAGKDSRSWEKGLRGLKTPGLRLHFSYEPAPLGTGGAIRFAAEALKKKRLSGNDPILVLNGDVFFDLDVRAFRRFHAAHKAVGTIALTQVDDPSRFGVVLTAADGRIRRFIEKPQQPVGTNLINAGAYLLDPAWIERIPLGRASSVERDAFPASLERGEPLFGFEMAGYWNDIGTHATYLQAHRDLMTLPNRWTRSAFLRKRGTAPGSDGARVLIGRGVRIGKNVSFEGVVSIGPRARIGDGCRLRDTVVLESARLDADVIAERSIIGPRVQIGKSAVLRDGTVLGEATRITPFTRC